MRPTLLAEWDDDLLTSASRDFYSLVCRHGIGFETHCKECQIAGYCACKECERDA
jgi:hypothetical protein